MVAGMNPLLRPRLTNVGDFGIVRRPWGLKMSKITLTMSLITYEKLLERCAEGSAEYICLKNAAVDSSESGVSVTVICDAEQAEKILNIAASRDPNLTEKITVHENPAPERVITS